MGQASPMGTADKIGRVSDVANDSRVRRHRRGTPHDRLEVLERCRQRVGGETSTVERLVNARTMNRNDQRDDRYDQGGSGDARRQVRHARHYGITVRQDRWNKHDPKKSGR